MESVSVHNLRLERARVLPGLHMTTLDVLSVPKAILLLLYSLVEIDVYVSEPLLRHDKPHSTSLGVSRCNSIAFR